ncbi:hypothetical protein QTP86_033808 [Hemibagrus guttatus]|nr:hypothetical protein QTP86_033808 [Hemibagrus guttatus]
MMPLKVFMFEFLFKMENSYECDCSQTMMSFISCFSVDAAREDGSLGRLVNDDHINPNSNMKIITEKGESLICVYLQLGASTLEKRSHTTMVILSGLGEARY